jgi:hypothetical protein
MRIYMRIMNFLFLISMEEIYTGARGGVPDEDTLF